MNLGERHTKTYIAASFDHDKDAVQNLYDWNDDKRLSFHFVDVHSLTQSYDTSLYCSIKRSLRERMAVSKTFVLIVGSHTKSVTKGSCSNCLNYTTLYSNLYYGTSSCSKGISVNKQSYIDYECDLAIKEGAKIIVLYKSVYVDKSLCPEKVRNLGTHVAMKCRKYNLNGPYIDWDYQAVKSAING